MCLRPCIRTALALRGVQRKERTCSPWGAAASNLVVRAWRTRGRWGSWPPFSVVLLAAQAVVP
eukprot:14524137-Alexandrium_andersonii.AAC.1